MSELKLTYFANLADAEEGGYIVTFRDLPNVFTEGDTLEEALFNAQEVLDGMLAVMSSNNEEINDPSPGQDGEYPIPVSPDIAAPILLHLLRKKRSQTMANVARAMSIPYQQYQRLEHNCNMTLKSLNKAAVAMGARVEIRVYLND